MRRTLLILLSAACLAAPAAAAGGAVTLAKAPPAARIPLAAPFGFKVEASLPENFFLKPDTATASNSEFEVLSFTKTAGEKRDGRKTETFEIKARAFALGVSTFPAITWDLRGEGIPEGTTVKTSTFTVEITPLFKTKEGEGIRDIYQPFRYFPWLWLLLLAAALGLGAWLFFSRKKPAGAAGRPAWADTRSPYQRARDRLGKLEKAPLAASGKLKEYYTGLIAILRFYLAEEFSIDAAQMTTTDLGRELKKTGADIKTALKAREFMQKADLVKFARLKPGDAAGDSEELAEMLMEFNRVSENAKTLAAEKAAAEAAAKAKGNRP